MVGYFMMEWLLVLLFLAIVGLLFWRRHALRVKSFIEFDEAVEYTGALRSVLEGGYPEFLALLPPVPGRSLVRRKQEPSKVSSLRQAHGESEDATRLSTEADRERAEDAVERTKTQRLVRLPEAGGEKVQAPVDSEPISEADLAGTVDFQFPEEIIGEYDIRGVFAENLHARTAFYLGRALAVQLRERGESHLAISRDTRVSSTELAQGLAKGLRSVGLHVVNTGIIPTPVHYFGLHTLDLKNGVMVTGSHNPSSHNGFKIQLGGRPLWGEGLRGALREIRSSAPSEVTYGTLRGAQVSSEYFKQAIKKCEDLSGTPSSPERYFKVVVDGANSIGGKFAAHMLRKRGFQAVELYCDLDSSFPNHPPDPTQPENLKALIEKIREENADVGFALDGDADRLVLIDEQGGIVWPDQVLMFLASDVLSRYQGGKVIYDVKCSHHLARHVKSLGGEPLMWKTGHSLIRDKILEEDAVLGGEMSGHLYLCKDWHPFDDGLFGVTRLADMLSDDPRPVSEIFKEIPGGTASQEYRILLPRPEILDFMDQFTAEDVFPGAERIELDGLRVQFKDRWGLVRASNTESCLVFRFEGDNAEALSEIQEAFRERCGQIAPDLKLPF